MILLDTSIWIEFLRGNKTYFNRVSEMLETGMVYSTEAIFAELLQRVRDQRSVQMIFSYWENTRHEKEAGLWLEAGRISYGDNLFNKGVGIIDAMIFVFARKFNARIWTLDKKLLSILPELYIYEIKSGSGNQPMP